MIHAANTPLPVPGGMPITDKVIPLPPQGGTNWAWVQWPHQSPGGKVTWEYSRQPQCDHCCNYGHARTSCPDLPGTRYTCCGRTKEDEQYTEHGPGLAGPMEPAGQQQTHQQPPRPPMTDQRWNYAEQTTNTLPPRPPTTDQGWNHAEQTMNTLQQIHQTPPSYRQRRGKKGKGGRNLDQRMDRLVEDLAEIRTDLERAVKYMAQLKDRVNGQWDPQATSTFSLLNQTLNMIQSNVNENSNKDIYNCLNEGIVQREGESHPPSPGTPILVCILFRMRRGGRSRHPARGRGRGAPWVHGLRPPVTQARHAGEGARGTSPPLRAARNTPQPLLITNLFRVPSSCHLGVIQPGGPAGGAPPG